MRTLRFFHRLCLLPLVLIAVSSCNQPPADAEEETTAPRVEAFSHGPVEVTLTMDPPRVRFDRDSLLTIDVSAPSTVECSFPSLTDRFQGFLLAESYDPEPTEQNGLVQRQRIARLTPLIHHEYRIAPLVIEYRDASDPRGSSRWFTTQPLVFDPVPVSPDPVRGEIYDNLAPIWIAPSTTTIALYVALGAAVLALGALMIYLLTRIHRKVRLMRMSPRERALEELAALLKRKKRKRFRIKDFYVELTMIVRRYIERQHSIRAPEQTTQEFLDAIAGNPHFNRDTVRKLRDFLMAADLVKFAGYAPDTDTVDQSVTTARVYIETDADEEA